MSGGVIIIRVIHGSDEPVTPRNALPTIGESENDTVSGYENGNPS